MSLQALLLELFETRLVPDVSELIIGAMCNTMEPVPISRGHENNLSVTLFQTNMMSGFIVYDEKTWSVNGVSPVGSPAFHKVMMMILGRPGRRAYLKVNRDPEALTPGIEILAEK